MIKWLYRTFLILLALAGVFALGTYAYLQHPKFGDLPEGASLEAIRRSPSYADGVFRNVGPLGLPECHRLAAQVRKVVSGLGVGAYFERWGYRRERIHEADWNDSLAPDGDLRIHVLPARHYSGRMLTRNKTL